MKYPSIRIEGSIFSPDILEKLEDMAGQRPSDFGFDNSVKVKDEIVRCWADAQDYWRIFQRKLANLKPESPATTETRQQWIVPFLGLMGYSLEYQVKACELNEKTYAISHRLNNRDAFPIHIIGYQESAGLDRKPERSRMSAHAMIQEYLNLTEQLYGLVTNGRVLRLLRDSSRLIKLSYLEFDLDRIFNDGLFADFALLYRLLHVTRLPQSQTAAAESLLERYHQDSLESGARIRDGLSRAVETAIRDFGNGFVNNPANTALREHIVAQKLLPADYYQQLLRLIYRLLFLFVIEECDLIFPSTVTASQREIYDRYYSLQRLRRLSEKRFLATAAHHDLWLGLLSTFNLFEKSEYGEHLNIAPLAGDLFGSAAIGLLNQSRLNNDVLVNCIRQLSVYAHPDNKQLIRVNYAALNVEEFGSVYEGLLEYEPVFQSNENQLSFTFAKGEQRAATGSHYTPDDLVQPLIKHSLDYLLADKRKQPNPEQALLSLRVADIACGSGHILLAAARRIATELAIVRTGEEQPSPSAFRAAIRDVICTCIYGVDLNPLAVELCKVALWLEAHNPAQPLNFLDHHIKCGNAIVGFARREELERGIPDEAFATLAGDEKDIAALFRKLNKSQRSDKHRLQSDIFKETQPYLDALARSWGEINRLPETTPAQIAAKKRRYQDFLDNTDNETLRELAALPIAQFYIPKTNENRYKLMTDGDYRQFLRGQRTLQGQAGAEAFALSLKKRFFHWFLEFPDIMQGGGFDCILGNPPYLGGQALSGTYGHGFCQYVKWEYAPTGLSELVVYFLRRIYSLLRPNGFTAFITTNSITDGDIRRDGLEQVIAQGGAINMAVRGIKWTGQAKLVVSLVALHKGGWQGQCVLDNQTVPMISAYFEDNADGGEPKNLLENAHKVFQGSILLGNGFLLTHAEANELIEADEHNQEVVFPTLNGREINNSPEQNAERSVINFFDWNIEKAQEYKLPFDIVKTKVKPDRDKVKRQSRQERWWQYAERASGLYNAIRSSKQCFVAAVVTKYLNFSVVPTNIVFTHKLYVFTTSRWDLYSVVQSTFHDVWARKYSGTLGATLNYSPSDCFITFPFPVGLWQTANPELARLGETYHQHRSQLMHALWLGLTDIYNLFHRRDLSPEHVAKVSKKSLAQSETGYTGILQLRQYHRELDTAIRNAYGWQDLNLAHDFYDIDTLPENDRVRYTISPTARKEILKRLLAENHHRAALQTTKITKPKRPKKSTDNHPQTTLDLIAQEINHEAHEAHEEKPK